MTAPSAPVIGSVSAPKAPALFASLSGLASAAVAALGYLGVMSHQANGVGATTGTVGAVISLLVLSFHLKPSVLATAESVARDAPSAVQDAEKVLASIQGALTQAGRWHLGHANVLQSVSQTLEGVAADVQKILHGPGAAVAGDAAALAAQIGGGPVSAAPAGAAVSGAAVSGAAVSGAAVPDVAGKDLPQSVSPVSPAAAQVAQVTEAVQPPVAN